MVEVQRFASTVADPRWTKLDLLQFYENAKRKGSSEHVDVVAAELDRRFPGWSTTKGKRGGSTPCVAIFNGVESSFGTAREGYVWLVERFLALRPTLFSQPSQETLDVALGAALGKSRNYFARTPANLFKQSPHLAENAANFARLRNGWVANVNLDNAQKFDILTNFGAVVGLSHPEDWDLKVFGSTERLAAKQNSSARVSKLLNDFLDGRNEPGNT